MAKKTKPKTERERRLSYTIGAAEEEFVRYH